MREPGSKMIVYADGKISGTIGGGKFEALVRDEALAAIRGKKPLLKTYTLREGEMCSFGAVCGGEVTVLIEPQIIDDRREISRFGNQGFLLEGTGQNGLLVAIPRHPDATMKGIGSSMAN